MTEMRDTHMRITRTAAGAALGCDLMYGPRCNVDRCPKHAECELFPKGTVFPVLFRRGWSMTIQVHEDVRESPHDEAQTWTHTAIPLDRCDQNEIADQVEDEDWWEWLPITLISEGDAPEGPIQTSGDGWWLCEDNAAHRENWPEDPPEWRLYVFLPCRQTRKTRLV